MQPTTVAQTGLLSRLKIDFHAITQPGRLAGRLDHFVQNWRLISSDPDVLAAVVGYNFEFTTFPVQTGPPPVLQFPRSDSAKLETEIQSLQQKGALTQVQPEADQILSNLFLVSKRDAPSDQPQGFEKFSPLHSFQDGGYPSPARSGSTGTLAGKNRPEGRLFCNTDLEGSPEVSPFLLEGHTSGICLFSVWSSARTEIVHQNSKARRCLASPGRYSIDNLPGRLVVHACNTGGATRGHGSMGRAGS